MTGDQYNIALVCLYAILNYQKLTRRTDDVFYCQFVNPFSLLDILTMLHTAILSF
jgi:hypothetical protein